MLELLKTGQYGDYFLPIAQRPERGVFFCCFIGCDDDLLLFLAQVLHKTQQNGVYIENGIQNPTGAEVRAFTQAIDTLSFSLDQAYFRNALAVLLPTLTQEKRDALGSVLQAVISEAVGSGNTSLAKNVFIKYMCWIKRLFEETLQRAGEEDPPVILLEGDASKHEFAMLHILHRMGCDIACIHFLSDESYHKADPKNAYYQLIKSKRIGNPKVHYKNIDLKGLAQTAKLKQYAQEASGRITTNSWIKGDLWEVVLQSGSKRGALAGQIYNIAVSCLGVDDKNEYAARIYKLKSELLASAKKLVFFEGNLTNPTLDEAKAVSYGSFPTKEAMVTALAERIHLAGDPMLIGLVRGAFAAFLFKAEMSPPQLISYATKMLCWLNRIAHTLFSSWSIESLPIILFYGNLKKSEIEFLQLMSSLPCDVLVLSPDKSSLPLYQALEHTGQWTVVTLGESVPLFPFPQQEPLRRHATAAYQAERELDTLLYNDTGLYRNRQFVRCQPVTLRTTYDEIKILWKQEARFRPSFEAGSGRVCVPNIFAKINGVPDGNAAAYFESIRAMVTDKTLFIPKFPHFRPDFSGLLGSVNTFLTGGRLQPEKILGSTHYQYDYLHEDTQDFLFDKIQQLLDLGWIHKDAGSHSIILSTLLSLDQPTLRLIQQFDFTKEIPKVVIIDVNEEMPFLEDVIRLAFLSLCGFDIVVFTPTGYRNIEKYLAREVLEEHSVGELMFHLELPPGLLAEGKRPIKEASLFAKLFRKDK